MKVGRSILKAAGAALALAAVICCVVAFWDQITDCFDCARDRIHERRRFHDDECDEYADWDAE